MRGKNEAIRTPAGDLERRIRADLAAAEPVAFEDLAAYVDGSLSPLEYEAFVAWEAVDPELSAEVRDLASLRLELASSGHLRATEGAMPSSRRLPRRYLAAAAALALALGSSWLATRIEPRQHDFPTAAAAVAVLPVAPPPAEVAAVPLSEPAPRSIPRVSETPAGSAMVASGQPGSFETGTLQGWQLPETRLDFEDGRVGPLASNPGA